MPHVILFVLAAALEIISIKPTCELCSISDARRLRQSGVTMAVLYFTVSSNASYCMV